MWYCLNNCSKFLYNACKVKYFEARRMGGRACSVQYLDNLAALGLTTGRGLVVRKEKVFSKSETLEHSCALYERQQISLLQTWHQAWNPCATFYAVIIILSASTMRHCTRKFGLVHTCIRFSFSITVYIHLSSLLKYGVIFIYHKIKYYYSSCSSHTAILFLRTCSF